MDFEAIIFDLDGTLLDTLEDLANSMNKVLTEMGFPPHPTESYRYFIGEGTPTLVYRALPEEARTEDNVKKCLDRFLAAYSTNWNSKTRPYDGIPKMLDLVESRGLRIAILSNKAHTFTMRCVEYFLGKWNFAHVLGQRDGLPRKPSPAGALEISRSLSLHPSRFLYLGDSGIDMETATAAGMYPVGALWGSRDSKELLDSGAKALIEHPLEIGSFLD
ncbi:MAG: HAD family hydrolase [Deltaproteobacteria bacterium]|nr:HAD family hydrolase [Deltaproteobacteria bacterium]